MSNEVPGLSAQMTADLVRDLRPYVARFLARRRATAAAGHSEIPTVDDVITVYCRELTHVSASRSSQKPSGRRGPGGN